MQHPAKKTLASRQQGFTTSAWGPKSIRGSFGAAKYFPGTTYVMLYMDTDWFCSTNQIYGRTSTNAACHWSPTYLDRNQSAQSSKISGRGGGFMKQILKRKTTTEHSTRNRFPLQAPNERYPNISPKSVHENDTCPNPLSPWLTRPNYTAPSTNSTFCRIADF